MKICGIYQITCLPTGKRYIGSSADIKVRLLSHLADLRANRHPNIHLQRSWNKHGADQFKTEILKKVKSIVKLLCFEQRYLDAICPEFNIAKCAEASQRGVKRSLESRMKQSATTKGRPSNRKGQKMPPEAIAIISSKLKGNKYALGLRHTEDARRRMSESHKAHYELHPVSEETRRKIGEAHRGLKYSDEVKAKMSVAAKLRNAKYGNAMKGRKRPDLAERNRQGMSEETRSKLSESARLRNIPRDPSTGRYHARQN